MKTVFFLMGTEGQEGLCMIYVMSDTHGDLTRFRCPAVRRLRRRDTLIVLGDFGFIWNGSSREKRALRWLGRRRFQLLFLDGSHENYDMLKEYPLVDYAGDQAWKLGKNLYRLQRGGVYTIDGKTVLALGGAASAEIEREMRRESHTWWQEELPCAADYERCNSNLEEQNWTVDYILSHDGPARLISFLKLNRTSVRHEENELERYMDDLMKKVKYRKWCFGCYHLDQQLGSSACAVYRKLQPLWTEDRQRKKKG